MKKFVLTLVIDSRSNPAKIIVSVIAHKAKDARELASARTVEKCPDPKIWLDSRKTSCKGHKTKRLEIGIESIATH